MVIHSRYSIARYRNISGGMPSPFYTSLSVCCSQTSSYTHAALQFLVSWTTSQWSRAILFGEYFATLSVRHTVYHLMIWWLMNDELVRIWNATIVAQLLHYSAICLKEQMKTTKNLSNIIADVLAEIWTEEFPTKNLEYYRYTNLPCQVFYMLTVAQLVKKFLAPHGKRKLITMFTKCLSLLPPLSQLIPIQCCK